MIEYHCVDVKHKVYRNLEIMQGISLIHILSACHNDGKNNVMDDDSIVTLVGFVVK